MTGLIPVPKGQRAFIVRVDPTDHCVRDDLDQGEPDWSLWYVEAALDDRSLKSLRSVQRHIVDWMRLWTPSRDQFTYDVMADVHITCALHHPGSPFGLGYRFKKVPEHVDLDRLAMLLIYRGDFYGRDRRGVLTPLDDERAPDWPTPERFWAVRELTLDWARRKGML